MQRENNAAIQLRDDIKKSKIMNENTNNQTTGKVNKN